MTDWRRTFYSAWLAQILSITGFSFVMPFLPFYIRYLGVKTDADVAIWSGIATSATALTLAIFQPIWGVLADRYGRKSMVLRSMLSGAVILVLMGFCRNVQQLVVCRLVQGAFTGTIAASVALVASVTPARHTGYALGMMQAAAMAGFSVGPLIGGVVADKFGFRAAFFSGALVLLAAALLTLVGTREEFTPPEPDCAPGGGGFGEILVASGFLAAALVLFSIRFSTSIPNPAFPLIVLDMRGTDQNLNTVTGSIIFCAGAAAAVSAGMLGKLSDAWGHRRLLVVCGVLSAVASFLTAFVRSIPQLYVARVLLGVTTTGMIPPANALIREASAEKHLGKAYGATTSISSLGWFFGPLAGGYLAAHMGVRMPFVAGGIGQVLVTLIVLGCVRRETARPGPQPDG